jgi:hypothetical protein
VVKELKVNLAAMAKMRKVTIVRGYGARENRHQTSGCIQERHHCGRR